MRSVYIALIENDFINDAEGNITKEGAKLVRAMQDKGIIIFNFENFGTEENGDLKSSSVMEELGVYAEGDAKQVLIDAIFKINRENRRCIQPEQVILISSDPELVQGGVEGGIDCYYLSNANNAGLRPDGANEISELQDVLKVVGEIYKFDPPDFNGCSINYN